MGGSVKTLRYGSVILYFLQIASVVLADSVLCLDDSVKEIVVNDTSTARVPLEQIQ